MATVKGAGTMLASWNDTPATQAIVEFVERVTQEGGADYVPPAERIAVFDNDGTLWCEKPMQIEVGFILKRLAEMAEPTPRCATASRGRRPTSATMPGSGARSPSTTTETTTDVKVLMAGIVRAFAGMTVEDYADRGRGVPARAPLRRSIVAIATAPTCR